MNPYYLAICWFFACLFVAVIVFGNSLPSFGLSWWWSLIILAAGTAPIIVWQRNNGDLEVISGRHRLDLARRSGEQTIPAQVLREADGFDAKQAASLDSELNIRDGQGKVKDYVHYFQSSGLTQEEADLRGLVSRSIGKTAFTIANDGSEELIAAHRAGAGVADGAAYAIARTAPKDARLQAVGIKAVRDGNSAAARANLGLLDETRRGNAEDTGP